MSLVMPFTSFKFSPCFCISLETGCYLTGVMFVATCLLNALVSSSALKQHYSRSLQINLAFQMLFLMTVIPYFIGVYSRTRELVIPLMVAAIYSAVLSLVMMGVNYGRKSQSFFISCAICVGFNLYFALVAGFYWWELSVELQNEANEQVTLEVQYPYRRFGNFHSLHHQVVV